MAEVLHFPVTAPSPNPRAHALHVASSLAKRTELILANLHIHWGLCKHFHHEWDGYEGSQ
jgi:hypothetical protein